MPISRMGILSRGYDLSGIAKDATAVRQIQKREYRQCFQKERFCEGE